MGERDGTATQYEIDADDRITQVSDTWLAFARENDAPGLTREAVVGRPIWDFIAGAETRELYRAILRRVRDEDVQVILPFRCDSPAFRRDMRLVITPGVGGDVRFSGLLVRKLERLHLGVLEPRAPRSSQELAMCSCCKRVAIGAEWLEPEDAVARFYELGEEPYPSLKQVLCDACRDAAEVAAIGGAG